MLFLFSPFLHTLLLSYSPTTSLLLLKLLDKKFFVVLTYLTLSSKDKTGDLHTVFHHKRAIKVAPIEVIKIKIIIENEACLFDYNVVKAGSFLSC